MRCDGDGVAIKNVNLTEFHHCATVNAVWPSPLTRIGSEVEAEPEAEAEAEAEPETEAGVDANAEAIWEKSKTQRRLTVDENGQ